MNKIALVTGSSTGIGAGIAKLLGTNGYTAVVTYKENKAKADEVVKFIEKKKGQAITLQLDVTSEESVQSVMKSIEKQFGKLDVLVNNAAVDWLAPIDTCTFEDWKTITRTKIDGNFLCTKYAIPLLKKSSSPHIIIIMSNMDQRVDPEDPAYCVGTAGTIAFMKTMALYLAKYGIRTNAVGPKETPTNSKYWQTMGSKEVWDTIAKKNPLGRVGTPEDVGKTVKMVIEEPTGFMNGSIFYVTGGSHLL